jgi:hypothetical protein
MAVIHIPKKLEEGTTTERTAYTPQAGQLFFDTTFNTYWFYNGSAWKELAVDSDYIETEMTAITTTTTADTWIDVDGSTLSLTAGRWEIGYFVCFSVRDKTGSIAYYAGQVAVTTAADSIVSGTRALIGCHSQSGGIQRQDHFIHAKSEITVSSTTSYKLRIKCSASDASADARIFAGDLTDISGDEVDCRIYAKKLRSA